jgi:anaerobic magnesium-protoporphyrin IX monomethyl ester cyclase
MKIVFVFPPKTKFFWANNEIFKRIDEESGHYPSLGLLYVATYVKENTPHTVSVIDCPTEAMDYASLEERLRREQPDIIGIYGCTQYVFDMLKTARTAKRSCPRSVVVAGGPHIVDFPRESIAEPALDYCVYGEGEIAFKELTDSLDRASEPEKIPGVISRKNAHQDHVLQKVDDIDALPFPDRTLLPVNKYRSFITYDNPITTMMTSRGCSFNCYYCSNIERGQKVRMRSAHNVVEEITEVLRLGIKDIVFFDENFTFDPARVLDICDELIAKRLKVRWHCRSRADMKLDDAVLRKMNAAGCRMIQFGVDAGTQRLQQVINKRLDLEKVRRVVRRAKDAGILVYGNFMLGHPTETKEEMLQTIDFAVRNDFDYVSFSIFDPLPGSVFYLQGLENGIIPKDYWREYVKNPEEFVADYFWPEHDKNMLNAMYQYAIRSFYLRPSYVWKALAMRQSFKQKLWQAKSALRLFVLEK